MNPARRRDRRTAPSPCKERRFGRSRARSDRLRPPFRLRLRCRHRTGRAGQAATEAVGQCMANLPLGRGEAHPQFVIDEQPHDEHRQRLAGLLRQLRPSFGQRLMDVNEPPRPGCHRYKSSRTSVRGHTLCSNSSGRSRFFERKSCRSVHGPN